MIIRVSCVSLKQLAGKVRAYGKLVAWTPSVYVYGTFRDQRSRELVFLLSSGSQVRNIGRRWLTVDVDGKPEKVEPLGEFRADLS